MQIAQACRPCLKGIGAWDSVMELSRAYEAIMGLVIFMPVVVLSWFPFMSEFQTRFLFNQAFSRGLQISMILAGKKDDKPSSTWHLSAFLFLILLLLGWGIYLVQKCSNVVVYHRFLIFNLHVYTTSNWYIFQQLSFSIINLSKHYR